MTHQAQSNTFQRVFLPQELSVIVVLRCLANLSIGVIVSLVVTDDAFQTEDSIFESTSVNADGVLVK